MRMGLFAAAVMTAAVPATVSGQEQDEWERGKWLISRITLIRSPTRRTRMAGRALTLRWKP